MWFLLGNIVPIKSYGMIENMNASIIPTFMLAHCCPIFYRKAMSIQIQFANTSCLLTLGVTHNSSLLKAFPRNSYCGVPQVFYSCYSCHHNIDGAASNSHKLEGSLSRYCHTNAIIRRACRYGNHCSTC